MMKRMSRAYRPLIVALALVVVVADFVRIDAASHSVSDTLINWLPQTAVIAVLAALLVMLAERLAKRA